MIVQPFVEVNIFVLDNKANGDGCSAIRWSIYFDFDDGCIGVKKIVIHDDLIVDSQDKEDAHYNLPQSSMLGIHH